jgi:hypothetical protein
MNPMQQTRREFLTTSAGGLGGMAVTAILAGDGFGGATTPLRVAGQVLNPLAARDAHFAPKAKSCIFFFMAGAPSQFDLFDYKPELNKLHGQKMPQSLTKGVRFAFLQKDTATLMGSPRTFRQHGDSGMWFSDALPNIATCADDICMIKSMHTEQFNHHPGQLFMQCGQARFGLPSMGSWISYGLGTENENMPSYVVLTSGRGSSGGATLWANGFLSSVHAGVLLRNDGPPILNLDNPPGIPTSLQRKTLDALAEINRKRYEQIHDPEIDSRISNYELAFRMQAAAPELTDLSCETAETLNTYGIHRHDFKAGKDRSGSGNQFRSFATNCLLARRLVERGVRFVSIIFASWDHHSGLDEGIRYNATMADQPIAALVKDLKQRGLLEETLVVWASEFGRTPLGENRVGYDAVTGRDHHPNAFTVFMAGGGSKGGTIYGETDEIGWNPVGDPVHVNDFQATLLHLFGLDHRKLTHRHQGVDHRLTNMTRQSHVIPAMLAGDSNPSLPLGPA